MLIPLATLKWLIGYHYYRRDMLFAFLAELPPEALTRQMNVGWESILGTLVHCLFAEEFWVQHRIQGQGRPEFDPAHYPDLASFLSLADEVKGRTMAYIAALTEGDLGRVVSTTFPDGSPFEFTVSHALMHVTNHDAHHLGQVVALARQLGYTPPELDML